ncbi:MAG TPA: HIT domain-containing protein [Anaeromyxobacter sp.]|nr:HIT domain-containing protein [Anaeromyxobacter sp.]
MNQPLWAPWRMEYIRSEKPSGCLFCRFAAGGGEEDRANLVVHRSAHAFACLNRFPYNSGHLMVIPKAHGGDPVALGPEAWADLQQELRRAIHVLSSVYRPEGMNVGMNLGQFAGAGILDHLHWHLVPRWAGDNNFMPVLTDTRVVIEALDQAWARLTGAFEEDAVGS